MIAPTETNNRAKAIERRDQWNATHPPGTFVRVWQSLPAGDWFVTRTKGEAFIHGNGVAVYVGMACVPIYLSNLEPISADALALLTHDDSLDRVNSELLANPPKPYQTRQPRPAMAQLPRGDRGDT